MKANDEMLPIREAAKLVGVSIQTNRSWSNQGKIKACKTPTGQRRFSKSQLRNLVSIVPDVKEKKNFIYCRVSSKKQANDLQRQINLLKEQYPDYELVTDCASGINFKRKGLKTILESAMSGNIKNVVVAHKDRLARFGTELIEWIIQSNGGKLIFLDHEVAKSGDQELAEDLLSIIHVFNCRQMGKRRYSSKKHIDTNLSDKEAEKDSN